MPRIVDRAGASTACRNLATLAVAIALLGSAAWASPASIDAGRRLAQAQCAACHAVGKSGDSRVPAASPFRVLTVRNPTKSLDEIVAGVLLTNHPGMPRFSGSDDQIRTLIDYLDTLQTGVRSH